MSAPIAHWGEVEAERGEAGHLAGWWTDLGSAAGSVTVGLQRIRIDPGKWSTPVHVELAEEEIFFVLAGSGLSWQEGLTYEIRAADCLVHLVEGATHTLNAGATGLEVLAFGTRRTPGGTYLPRAGVIRMGPGNAAVRSEGHPWEHEAEAGPPELPPASARPVRIVGLDGCPVSSFGPVQVRDLGRAAGSQLTGLCHVTLPPGAGGVPPHCHGAEEELFVVLEGDGRCVLGSKSHDVRTGSVVARPAATGVPHSFQAGPSGMTYLAYGTREPNDIVYYPREGKVRLRGVGLTMDAPRT